LLVGLITGAGEVDHSIISKEEVFWDSELLYN
jgi:hypothetical protein